MRVFFPSCSLVPAMVWISGLIAFSQETPAPPPEAPATGVSEPGVEALKRVRNLGFRLKDHDPAAAVAKSGQPAAAPAGSAKTHRLKAVAAVRRASPGITFILD